VTLAHQLAEVSVDRVVQLHGADVDAVAGTVAADLTDLAAVVTRPKMPCTTPIDFVDAALGELERVAVELLPAWLPDAAEIDRADLAGTAAVRMAATAHARRHHYSASFLADLAIFALTGRRDARPRLRMSARSAGLARIVAESFGRHRTLLLVPLAPDLTAAEQDALVAGADWLAHNGRVGVWLLGAPLTMVDRVPAVHLNAPAPAAAPWSGIRSAAVGKPHPASAVEAALEAALAAETWATGRMWNQSYQSSALSTPVRLDLFWPRERCIVELDGPEHCHPVHFEADRQRDVQLLLDGYPVLRFTNARVTHDVGAVVHQIGTYLRGRRRDIAEGRDHAGQ
jgi:very-short-patch-repair endonuclease